MHLDVSLVKLLLPILTDLTAGNQVRSERWGALQLSPALPAVLENTRMTLEQWAELWSAAARGPETPPDLTRRQQLMLQNARTALAALSDLHTAAALAEERLAGEMAELLQTEVLANLPTGTQVSPQTYLVLGISSGGGFFIGNEIYLDLSQLAAMSSGNPALLRRVLAHEIWHIGHYAVLAEKPYMQQDWMLPLFQLQSEGVANYAIGGSERDEAFLAYAASFETDAQKRLREYAEALDKLLAGDMEGYMAYQRTLPDLPGYLHGVYMARQIDRQLGRAALIATLPDPVIFLQRYQEAATVAPLPESLMARLNAAVS